MHDSLGWVGLTNIPLNGLEQVFWKYQKLKPRHTEYARTLRTSSMDSWSSFEHFIFAKWVVRSVKPWSPTMAEGSAIGFNTLFDNDECFLISFERQHSTPRTSRLREEAQLSNGWFDYRSTSHAMTSEQRVCSAKSTHSNKMTSTRWTVHDTLLM